MDLAFITDVEPISKSGIISDYVLKQNYPNPFNSNTNIEFSLPQTEQAKIRIYNTAGQLIKEIANGEFITGTHMVSWNGINTFGHKVASGIYFYSLETANQKITKKLTLSK